MQSQTHIHSTGIILLIRESSHAWNHGFLLKQRTHRGHKDVHTKYTSTPSCYCNIITASFLNLPKTSFRNKFIGKLERWLSSYVLLLLWRRGSVPSTHAWFTTVYNSSFRDQIHSFGFHEYQPHTWYTCIYVYVGTHIYELGKNKHFIGTYSL